MDASAKPASGFILGNNLWSGFPNLCNYVDKKIDIQLSDRFKRNMKASIFDEISPFKVEMKIIHVKHYSPYQGKLRRGQTGKLNFEYKLNDPRMPVVKK